MIKKILIAFLFLIISPYGSAAENDKCSVTLNRLKICFDTSVKDIFLSRDNTIQFYFFNDSDLPVRIYFIDNEVFRSPQNIFYIKGKFDRPVEPSPPHGYKVGYNDFHLIPPKGKKSFTHTLHRNELQDLEKNKIYELSWEYENDISDWKGGVMTLDGSTKTLFEGKKIPYIWVGKIQHTISINTK